MKKFLFVLLIAFIVAEENDSMTEKLVRFLETLPDILRKLYNWISKNNYWVEFIDRILERGKESALNFCVSITNPTLENICSRLIENLFNFFNPGD